MRGIACVSDGINAGSDIIPQYVCLLIIKESTNILSWFCFFSYQIEHLFMINILFLFKILNQEFYLTLKVTVLYCPQVALTSNNLTFFHYFSMSQLSMTIKQQIYNFQPLKYHLISNKNKNHRYILSETPKRDIFLCCGFICPLIPSKTSGLNNK